MNTQTKILSMINVQETAGELFYLLANGDTKKYIDKCYDLYLNYGYEYQEIQDILDEMVMEIASGKRWSSNVTDICKTIDIVCDYVEEHRNEYDRDFFCA